MGQKKGGFTPISGVKTRFGGAWFVQSVVFRGLVDLSGERVVAREEGKCRVAKTGFWRSD